DDSSGLVAVWASDRGIGADSQVYVSRIDRLDMASGFSNPPVALPRQSYETAPQVGLLPGGELIVSYAEVDRPTRKREGWLRPAPRPRPRAGAGRAVQAAGLYRGPMATRGERRSCRLPARAGVGRRGRRLPPVPPLSPHRPDMARRRGRVAAPAFVVPLRA